ncbi:MAG: hypothetical protein P4L81_01300 [Candidatus Pacebacteria bacterium]|nr:hypothetical protein [Candidatus Paceibacterota bacterium]
MSNLTTLSQAKRLLTLVDEADLDSGALQTLFSGYLSSLFKCVKENNLPTLTVFREFMNARRQLIPTWMLLASDGFESLETRFVGNLVAKTKQAGWQMNHLLSQADVEACAKLPFEPFRGQLVKISASQLGVDPDLFGTHGLTNENAKFYLARKARERGLRPVSLSETLQLCLQLSEGECVTLFSTLLIGERSNKIELILIKVDRNPIAPPYLALARYAVAYKDEYVFARI